MNQRVFHKDVYNRYAFIETFRSASLRLDNHDYSGSGAYHVIVCAKGITGRASLFENPTLRKFLQTNWLNLPTQARFRCTRLDEFVIMSDHIHFLIWPNKWPEYVQGKAPYLWDILRAYKSKVAVEWLNYVKKEQPDQSASIWQDGYFERIVRIGELEKLRQYIRENPLKFYEPMGWEKPF